MMEAPRPPIASPNGAPPEDNDLSPPLSPGPTWTGEDGGGAAGQNSPKSSIVAQKPEKEKFETPAAAGEFVLGGGPPPPYSLASPNPYLGVPLDLDGLKYEPVGLVRGCTPLNLTKSRSPVTPPDWSLRYTEAELDSFLLSNPRLWMHNPKAEDRYEREAGRLAQVARTGGVLTEQELGSLMMLYGLVVSQAVRQFCWNEISTMVVALSPETFREVQTTPTPLDCKECRVAHGLVRHPGTGQIGACVPRSYNSPRLLSLLGKDWAKGAKGVFIGLQALRIQPPHLYGQLINLSAISNDDFSVSASIHAESTSQEAREQPLFRFVWERLKKIEELPHLVVYLEYSPITSDGNPLTEASTAWGFIRTVQELQRVTFNPIVLLLPPPLPEVGSTEESFRELQKTWLETARRVSLMSTAYGVAFSPLVVYRIQGEGNTLVRSEFREEYLMNSRREVSREYQRRITCWLVKLQRAVASVAIQNKVFLARNTIE